MFSLLEFIFQGFLEWIYGLVLEIWEYFSSALLDVMKLDFAYMEAHIPVLGEIRQIVLALGWALLLGNLVFQALRSMVSGLGFEGEDPKLLFARSFVFSFLLLASPQICGTALDLTDRAIALLDLPDAIDVHLVDGSVFGVLGAAWLLVIIFDLIVMFMVFSLLLEVAERYMVLAMLTLLAPLAFAMGGSKSTSAIFAGWCRMYGSMCLLMAVNIVFFKMLLSVVATVPSGLDVFLWMVLIVSIVKVAKKADEIVTRIGLNPAITGAQSTLPGVILHAALQTGLSSMFRNAGGCSAAAGAAWGTSPAGRRTWAGTPWARWASWAVPPSTASAAGSAWVSDWGCPAEQGWAWPEVWAQRSRSAGRCWGACGAADGTPPASRPPGPRYPARGRNWGTARAPAGPHGRADSAARVPPGTPPVGAGPSADGPAAQPGAEASAVALAAADSVAALAAVASAGAHPLNTPRRTAAGPETHPSAAASAVRPGIRPAAAGSSADGPVGRPATAVSAAALAMEVSAGVHPLDTRRRAAAGPGAVVSAEIPPGAPRPGAHPQAPLPAARREAGASAGTLAAGALVTRLAVEASAVALVAGALVTGPVVVALAVPSAVLRRHPSPAQQGPPPAIVPRRARG